MRFPALYDYAGFFFNTLGGQAYLRRRTPRVESLVCFYALQVGVPGLDCLRANRMPNRITAWLPGEFDASARPSDEPRPPVLVIDNFEELPIASQSVDLVTHLASRGYVVAAADHIGR